MRGENGNAGMAEELRRLADALSRLVREHFDLARAEIRADATRWGKDLAVGFAALPFAVLGLLLLDLALAALLSRSLGIPGALALVGAGNLAIATVLGLVALRRMREARGATLKGSATELKESGRTLRDLGNGGNGRRPSPGPRVLPGPTPPRPGPPPPTAR